MIDTDCLGKVYELMNKEIKGILLSKKINEYILQKINDYSILIN